MEDFLKSIFGVAHYFLTYWAISLRCFAKLHIYRTNLFKDHLFMRFTDRHFHELCNSLEGLYCNLLESLGGSPTCKKLLEASWTHLSSTSRHLFVHQVPALQALLVFDFPVSVRRRVVQTTWSIHYASSRQFDTNRGNVMHAVQRAVHWSPSWCTSHLLVQTSPDLINITM